MCSFVILEETSTTKLEFAFTNKHRELHDWNNNRFQGDFKVIVEMTINLNAITWVKDLTIFKIILFPQLLLMFSGQHIFLNERTICAYIIR